MEKKCTGSIRLLYGKKKCTGSIRLLERYVDILWVKLKGSGKKKMRSVKSRAAAAKKAEAERDDKSKYNLKCIRNSTSVDVERGSMCRSGHFL